MTSCPFRSALGGALLSLSERQVDCLLALARKSNNNDDLRWGCWIVITEASPKRPGPTVLGGLWRRFRAVADFCIHQAKNNSKLADPFKVFVELVTLKAPQKVAFALFLKARSDGCEVTDTSDQIDGDCDVDNALVKWIIPRQVTDIDTDEDDHILGPRAALDDDSFIETDNVWALDENRNVVLRASVLKSTQLKDLPEVTSEGLWRGFQLPPEVFLQLLQHQKDFMVWMANIHARGDGSGGLCADHMGLGKTIQTLVFLGGLMRAGTIRNASVIVPSGLIPNWIREARIWLNACVDNVEIVEVSSAVHDVQKRRRRVLRALNATGLHVMVTSQSLVGKDPAAFKASKKHWDYVVVDEGQKVKNLQSRKNKGCEKICSSNTHRLMLSGTPLQNRPEEFWCILSWLFKNHGPQDFPRKRSLFSKEYGKIMEQGRNKKASALSVDKARDANEKFQDMIKPFFLKRQNDLLRLPKKQEFVVFIEMNKALRRLYSQTLRRDISELLQQTSETNKKVAWALPMLNKLQGACLHPCLVDSSQTSKKKHPRLTIMLQLIKQFKNEGHQTLIFSQSTRCVQYHSESSTTRSPDLLARFLSLSPHRMLDIIGSDLLANNDIHFLRIDGKVTGDKRQRIVNRFQNDSSITIMLLTTGAGGVGLNLTAATRVIFNDMDWASDEQSIHRCYRIGQKKEVQIFFLVYAGTVEGKRTVWFASNAFHPLLFLTLSIDDTREKVWPASPQERPDLGNTHGRHG